MHGLRHAAGFVQSKLASRLQTRFTPVIQFVLDEGVKKSIEMTRLINEALAESAPPPAEPTPRIPPASASRRGAAGTTTPTDPVMSEGHRAKYLAAHCRSWNSVFRLGPFRHPVQGVIDVPMATTINKQRLLTQLLTAAKKTAKPDEEARPVLEQFIYGLCRENATREQADEAYRYLREHFFDWNEDPRQLGARAGRGLRRPARRRERRAAADRVPAGSVRDDFSFDLERLHKKGLKQAAKQLARYQAANDYAVSWVMQRSLGGHAIPLDAPTLRCARVWG